jgi:anaerobic magnesium-protoporphyrin IX monomethyl ester cyclase
LRTLTPTPETRVHLFAPYPGTPLYDDALRQGFRPPESFEGWSKFDYYESQTPWTSAITVARARSETRMRARRPEQVYDV